MPALISNTLRWTFVLGLAVTSSAGSEHPTSAQPASGSAATKAALSKDPPGMKRLLPDADLWIDSKHKRIVLDGKVCLTGGPLEMFACIEGTKEHESIISVPIKAYAVHAGLMAVGAKPGQPVQFRPTYKPATGTAIDIELIWADKKGAVHRQKARNWIRNVKTGKPLDSGWVFAGSSFWDDPGTGQRHYLAQGGDFICVSNFPDAMLDLPVESSQAGAELLFEALTEAIPPKGTKVRLVLTPRLEKQNETQNQKK